MQRIGKPVFNFASSVLPAFRLGQPICPVGDISPDADIGDTINQRFDAAIDLVNPRNFFGDPVIIEFSGGAQRLVNMQQQTNMTAGNLLAEVGDLANLPQQINAVWIAQPFPNISFTGKLNQILLITWLPHFDQTRFARMLV